MKYYYLITGLPTISLEDNKIVYTVDDFWQEISPALSKSDRKLMQIYFLCYDNENIVRYLTAAATSFDPRGLYTYTEIDEVYRDIKGYDLVPANRLPVYMIDFFRKHAELDDKDERDIVKTEDLLSSFFYAYAMRSKNEFVRDWYELCLNINNVLTAITCRKYGLDKADYIVGDNEVALAIRSSNVRDFGLGNDIDYFQDLVRISEETDLMAREKRIDLLKWNWLSDNTFFKTFDAEALFAYMLKLEMIERWLNLDKATGEKTFREMVGVLTKESRESLNEFKKRNAK